MKFPNAAKGVKKLFAAEILTLIASFAMMLAIILAIITAASAMSQNEVSGGTIAAGLGTIILMVGSAVVAMVGGIMSLVGIIQASKDEDAFKTALYATILSLIAAVVYVIFSGNVTVTDICQIVQNVMSIIVTVYVITGITNLAEKLNNSTVSQKGRNLLLIIVVVYVLSLFASIIALFFGGVFATVSAGIIGLVSVVLNIVAYIIYLTLLSKGNKMLA